PKPTVVVIAKPFQAYPTHLFTKGVSLITTTVRRNLATALSPQIKSLNFLNNILAKQEATKADAFDGVMLNAEGHLTECTTSNIFFVQGKRLCTPSVACGILDGITRDVILTLAREQALLTEEQHYLPEALRQADEVFLTNTTFELMPVREVNGHAIGGGQPGPVTKSLHEAFRTNLSRFLA
ncbi:MAG: aminotransferase class IV, partial [Nitrospira sp.]